MKQFLKSIKPTHKESDKFSWNLYKWCKKNCKHQIPKVYFSHWSNWDGSYLEKGWNKSGQIFISHFEDAEYISAQYLSNIFGTTKGGAGNAMFAVNKKRFQLEEVTEEFWKTYLKIGRCMFDEKHIGWWVGEENRYTIINKNSKRCNWCGKYLRRKIETEKVIKRHEIWEVE